MSSSSSSLSAIRLLMIDNYDSFTYNLVQYLGELGAAVEVVRNDVEETGSTLEENALLKARAVVGATGLPVIADDTGLEVEALGGGPGVHSARYAGPDATYDDNVSKMLAEMDSVEDRGACFVTVVALVFPDGVEVHAEDSLQGEIISAPRGDGGFGYDPIFEVAGRTLAEMTPEEKNDLSHRARAIRALMRSLGL